MLITMITYIATSLVGFKWLLPQCFNLTLILGDKKIKIAHAKHNYTWMC